MALTLDFEFTYDSLPSLALAVTSRETGIKAEIEALIDTGADGSLFDRDIALVLGIDLSKAKLINFAGVVAGQVSQGRVAEVELQVVSRPDITAVIEITFAENVAATCGNLLGLNFLVEVDLGLSHSTLTGYLGRPAT